jgi:hypothetical protein
VILYKHCSPDRIDVLQKRRIRFTPPGSFNDPFEFRPVIKNLASDADIQSFSDREFEKILDEELAKFGAAVALLPPAPLSEFRATLKAQLLPMFRAIEPNLLVEVRKRFDEAFNKHFGILCLSEHWDSILMWSHYSQAHEGFSIGFDSTHRFFNQKRTQNDEFGHLRRVHYQKARPVVSLMNSDSVDWCDTKADVWSYEDEWRMFFVLSNASETKTFGSAMIHLFDFPSDSVKEVVLGSKCGATTEATIRSILGGWPSPVSLYRCDIDDSDYKMIRKNA